MRSVAFMLVALAAVAPSAIPTAAASDPFLFCLDAPFVYDCPTLSTHEVVCIHDENTGEREVCAYCWDVRKPHRYQHEGGGHTGCVVSESTVPERVRRHTDISLYG